MQPQAVVGTQGDVVGRVLAAVPSPVVLWRRIDDDFRLVDANPAAADFLGRSREQLIGLTPSASPGNSARVRRDMHSALRSGKSVVRSARVVGASGRTHNFEITYVPLAPGHVLGFARDVTDEQRTQEELRISRSRYETLVNASPHGIWLVDARGRTAFANQRVGQILGHPSDLIVRSNLLDFVDLRDRASVAGALECPRDTPESFEARFRHREGHEVLCLISLRPVAARGSAPATLCTLADMTALQQERELRAAGEKRFRRMVETASEGIWTGDAHGRTTFVNEAAARMVGLDPAEMVGRPFSDFVVDGEWAREARAELRRTHQPVRAEFRLAHAEGRPVDVIASLSVLWSDDGAPYGALAMVTDVTELKRERENLLESRQRFAQVFDEAPVGMVFIAAGRLAPGSFLGANRVFLDLLGYTEDELADHDLLSITHPADVAAERELVQDLFDRRRDHYEIEKRLVRADGGVVWVRFRAGVLRDLRGAPLYGLGVAVDISAQKRAAEEAATAAQRFERLFRDSDEPAIVLDTDGLVTEANPGFCRLVGRRLDHVLQRYAGELLAPADDDAPAPWASTDSGDEPVATLRRVVRAEGGVTTVRVSASTVRDADGKPTGLICRCVPREALALNGAALHDGEPLSDRERQVLELLARGLDGPAIAERLGLAQETIRAYTQSARAKCGARTRTEAVVLALARGQISL